MIGMVVVGLFLAGIATVWKAQIAKDRVEQTRETIRTVQTSLLNYARDEQCKDPAACTDAEISLANEGALTTGGLTGTDAVRFPCPASLTAAPGMPGFGEEVCPADLDGDGEYTDEALAPGPVLDGGGLPTGVWILQGSAGNLVLVGTVPVQTLGIHGEYLIDPFKRRLTYAVSLSHVDTNAMASGNPAGAITVNAATDVPYLIISHGLDGRGTYSWQGGHVPCDTALADGQNCAWQIDPASTTPVAFSDAGFSTAAGANYFDDKTSFGLIADSSADGWWRATDATQNDITHKNPGNELLPVPRTRS